MFAKRPWNPLFTVGLFNLHAGALAAFVLFPPRPIDIALAFFGYCWFGLASSLYYHRYLTHRGFEMATPVSLFFLMGGIIGLSGDPVRWVATHRYHHQRPDKDDDIHSPRDGWWYAHFGWLAKLDMAEVDKMRPLASDIRQVPYLKVFESPVAAAVPHVVYTALLFGFLGAGGVCWGLYVPIVLSFHFGWMMIASFCHLPSFGVRASDTPDHSRNIPWLGLFSFGESFHNHHHAYPKRAKHGVAWYEPDPTKYLIWLMSKVGLVWNVVWDDPRGRKQVIETMPAAVPSEVLELIIPEATKDEVEVVGR